MNMKNCAIYTRVSTDNQAEKEFSSCEAQEQKIRSFIASQNDWQVFKVYNDAGFSGAILQRPALQELLADLKKEKDQSFEDTATYRTVTKLYKEKTGKEPFYAMMPEVVISGPKLSRDYNTNWFASRVNGRYQTCMNKIKHLKI